MKIKFLFPIMLFVLTGTLGCQKTDSSMNQLNAETPQTKVVKEVKIHNPPPSVQSPSEAVIHQYEVVFEDQKSEYPEKGSILSETTLGNKSIVAIRSPESRNSYSVFLYHYNDEWMIDSHLVFDVLENTMVTDKEGLALPVDKFRAVSMNISEEEKLWAFADQQVIMTIGVLNQYPIPEELNAEKVILENGTEAFISKDPYQNNFLYYYDTDKVIVVSGNVNRSAIIELANTIPSVTNASFPGNN